MVSRGRVNSDASSLKSLFTQYDGFIGELGSFWTGPSHDNLAAKAAEFSSSYSNSLQSQMTSFAAACDLYENYKSTKQSISIAESNYNSAVSSNDTSAASRYSSEVSELKARLDNLKTQIKSYLQTVKGIKLEGSSASEYNVSVGANGVTFTSTSATIQSAIDWAIATAADDTHGYSQQTRNGNPNYDCSSFVIAAYDNAGIPVKEAGASYTGNMKNAFIKCGFEWIPGTPNMDDLLPGDVLLSERDHTEMYIGDGKNVGAHGNLDGVNGDSSGKELSVSDYPKRQWDGVLRYTGQVNNG